MTTTQTMKRRDQKLGASEETFAASSKSARRGRQRNVDVHFAHHVRHKNVTIVRFRSAEPSAIGISIAIRALATYYCKVLRDLRAADARSGMKAAGTASQWSMR